MKTIISEVICSTGHVYVHHYCTSFSKCHTNIHSLLFIVMVHVIMKTQITLSLEKNLNFTFLKAIFGRQPKKNIKDVIYINIKLTNGGQGKCFFLTSGCPKTHPVPHRKKVTPRDRVTFYAFTLYNSLL